MYDVVVVGGGLNGLVAALTLARRKLSTLVIDRQPIAGGAAVTASFAPGFLAPTLSHALGPIRRDVARALHLERLGLDLITPDPALTALAPDGRRLAFNRDPVFTAASIEPHSHADSGQWRPFLQTTQRIAGVVAEANRHVPPDMDDVSSRDLLRLLRIGRRVRKLGRRDLARLARWIPMSISDITGEWFESDLLRAALASRAVLGNPAGPRSAGTGLAWLQRLADDPMPVGSGVTVRGGPGALAAALVQAIEQAGGRVRTDTRATGIAVEGGRATAVIVDGAEEIGARSVVAAIDPRQALLSLIDPAELPPTFRERVGQYRARGVMAKVNLALSALPAFPALEADPTPLRGRLLFAPGLDYLERAFDDSKYGRFSAEPWLEAAIPTVVDPSLAPSGGHVMSIYVQYVPRRLAEGTWDERRGELLATVLDVLGRYAPGIETLVAGSQVLTPEDFEREWGLDGGHIFHGEPTMDQSWAARPLLGWAGYRTPIAGLYLASAGTHPGGGLTGASGYMAAAAMRK